MRSEITQRIIDETPERVKDEVKEYAKNRIRMNDKERKIHVLEMVLELCWPRLLPEELADLRSLMEDLKKEDRWPKWDIEIQNQTVEVPDELLPALNTIIFQMRLYTISKRQNEALTAIKILHSMQKFFAQNEPLQPSKN